MIGVPSMNCVQLIEDIVARGTVDRSAAALSAERSRRVSPEVLLVGGVQLILDAVREQQHHIAGLRLENDLFVLAVVEQADRHAFDCGLYDLACAADHRRHRAGVGDASACASRCPKAGPVSVA